MIIAEKETLRDAGEKLFLGDMEQYYPTVTALTALSAKKFIAKIHENNNVAAFSNEEIKILKKDIDMVAANTMSKLLHEIPFQTIKVGSEGDKEAQYDGQASASVKGIHGKDGHPKTWGVSDVVEGTDFAARNQPGASSVLAITENEGIKPTKKDVNYMMKLIGPLQAKGVMSLNNEHENNLRNLISVLGIKPDELTQVTIDPSNPKKPGRKINQQYIDGAKKVGVHLEIIDAGDFMPSIRAAMDPWKYELNPVIVVGRGGFEEGTMAAAAAKALGGFMEAKEYDDDPGKMADKPVWSVEDLIPCSKNLVLLSASFITDVDKRWFNKPGITTDNKGVHEVTTLVITHKGIEFKTESFI